MSGETKRTKVEENQRLEMDLIFNQLNTSTSPLSQLVINYSCWEKLRGQALPL